MWVDLLLICRADADQELCTGHVMRAIALGENWRRVGGKAILLTKCEPWLRERALKSFDEVYPLSSKDNCAETLLAIENVKKRYATEDCWISLDGYHFDESCQKSIKGLGHPLLVFDDYAHLSHYSADIILNQNAGSDLLTYNTNQTKLLLGTDYVMMRNEFLSEKPAREYDPDPKRILVTMGGVDAPNATQIVLDALIGIESNSVIIRVLVGRANPHCKALERFIADNIRNTELVVQADNMSGHYLWSNMAITAAGTTSWELCYFGIPAMLVQIADNQRAIANHLGQTGAAINLGWFSELNTKGLSRQIDDFISDETLRRQMSKRAKSLVDGRGGDRLIQEMKRISNMRTLACEEIVLS